MVKPSNEYWRRKNNSVPAIIIIASTLVMILCMVLFFMSAWKRNSQTVTQTPEHGSTVTDKQGESADISEASTERISGIATEPILSTNSIPSKATEPLTEPDTQSIPKPPSGDVIPVYQEELFASVALPAGTAPEGYRDKLVFFGDSTTHGMKAYKVFGSRDTTQVWTPTSGTLALFRAVTDLIYNPNTGEEQLLCDLAAAVKPEYLIVTLGVNGVSFMDEEYFKTEYQNVIDTILKASPDTKLILQSIYPVARSYEKQQSINNQKICDANAWIVELADANQLPYLNTYAALVGEDGYLPEDCQNGDGMHLNEAGFSKIMDYVINHPYQS